ncbi:hypothetical protein [Pseudolysinimonas sp.]|jgi:DNA-binding IclR family transcriptional regulator|uniref:hypothetical protein n=1 Tax=Pseudolysinimonas sp. TaxID=2680009 RepID=UPI003784109F
MTEHVTAALRVLQDVAGRPDPTAPRAVGSIARDLGMTLSRASRLCAELEATGMLERGGAYGHYRIGAAGVRLSGRAAAPFARSLRFALLLAAQQTGETVLLAARGVDGFRVIDAVESLWTLHSPAEVGDRVTEGAVLEAAGILAGAPAEAGRAAVPLSESPIGMGVEIASPVLGPSGECFAVLAVRLPANRLEQNGPRARRAVVAASRTISRTLEDWLSSPPAATEPQAATEATSPLEAALAILRVLADRPDSVAGVSRATGLRPDRVQRLIDSCRNAGLLQHSHDRTTRFQLGWIVQGWYRAASVPTMVEHGRPRVAEAANRTLTCGFITILKGMRSFTIVEELGLAGDGLRMTPWLGRAHPMIGSDGGPTLTMDFRSDEITLLFPARHTPQELQRFLTHADLVARDGVLTMEAFDDAGLLSISAPVRDASGSVIAAACIVGTTAYMRANLNDVEEAARRLAVEVTALLQP